MSRQQRRRQKYEKRIVVAMLRAADAGVVKPGDVALIDLEHDAWCNVHRGVPRCNCNPAIGEIHVIDSCDLSVPFITINHRRKRDKPRPA